MPALRQQKITLAEMRAAGVRGLLQRRPIAANKLGEGLQLHWLGVVFQDVVVQKSPRYCRDQQSADQRLFNIFCYSY